MAWPSNLPNSAEALLAARAVSRASVFACATFPKPVNTVRRRSTHYGDSFGRIARTGAFAGALLRVLPSHASPDDPPAVSGVQVESAIEVSVEGVRRPNDPTESELTYTTDAEQIRASTSSSLVDAMRYRPGVSVQQTTPGQGTLQVRGFSGRAVVHVVDGVRLNTAFFRAGNNPYVSLVDPFSLQSLEVVTGPASASYGSDGLGGAVVMRTPLAGYSSEPRLATCVYQSLGSNPLGGASHLQTSYSTMSWAASAGITLLNYGDVYPGGEVKTPVRGAFSGLRSEVDGTYHPTLARAQEGTAFNYYATNTSLQHRIAPGLQLVHRAQFSVRPELLRYDQVNPLFAAGPPARADAALRPMYRALVSSMLQGRALDRWYDEFQVQLAWQRIAEGRESRNFDEVCASGVGEPPECDSPTALLPSGIRGDETNASDQFSARAQVRLGNDRDSTVATLGVEASHDVLSSGARDVELQTGEVEAAASRYPDGSTQSQVSAFGRLSDALVERLRMTAAGRLGIYALDITARPAPEPSPAQELTQLGGAAQVGLLWLATHGLAVVANLGTGFRAPNVQDLASVGTRAGGRFQVPNTDLRPETSLGADLGLKLDHRRLRGRVALFWLQQDGAIVLAPTTLGGAQVTDGGEAIVRSVNAGAVETYGTEGVLELRVLSQWELFSRWLSMLGEQRNPPATGLPAVTPADRIAPIQGELGARYLVSRQTSVEVFVAGRKRQQRLNDPTNLDDNRIPTGGTPGYVTYNARVSHALSRQLRARLSLDNITNEAVLEHGSGFYRAGFNATLAVEGSFDSTKQ